MGWNGTRGMEKLLEETNGVLKRKIRKAGFGEDKGRFLVGSAEAERWRG
jgi:hypothetical protein